MTEREPSSIDATISERLGAFVESLSFDSLPLPVLDKVKALLLHGLLIGLASRAESDVAIAQRIALKEPTQHTEGARLLSNGARVSRSWATFANSVLLHARGQDDSFRMLTHPGCCIIPATLAAAEGRELNGRDLLSALAAAYEVHCRLARDFVPSVQNRGFRSSAVFGVFGSVAATSKVLDLNSMQIAHALALAVSFASGNLETGRAGTREMTFQEPVAAQTGMLAATLAGEGITGAPKCFEGAAGFLNSFTGNTSGQLSGSFEDTSQIELNQITAELGERWELHGVTMKIYSGAGFVQPVIEGCAQLAQQYDIDPSKIRTIHIEMNQWEILFPSPLYPRMSGSETDEWHSAHFAAEALINRGYPSTGRRMSYGGRDTTEELPAVQELTRRVRVTAGQRPQYGPRITISMENGQELAIEMTGDEFKWDLDTERRRIKAVYPAIPFHEERITEIVDTISELESLGSIDRLIDLLTADH